MQIAQLLITLFASIGGLLGGIAALIAIKFLRANLKEMREQKELEYRGFIAVDIRGVGRVIDFENPHSEIKRLKISYRFPQTKDVPLILKARDWLLTSKNKINVERWYGYIKSSSTATIVGPVVLNILQFAIRNAPIKARELFRKLDQGEKAECKFFAHCILAYEDAMKKNSWVYMRWAIIIQNIRIPKEGWKPNVTLQPEEYRILYQD